MRGRVDMLRQCLHQVGWIVIEITPRSLAAVSAQLQSYIIGLCDLQRPGGRIKNGTLPSLLL